MCSSSSALLPLHIPAQKLKARGLTLIYVLLNIGGGEVRGVMVCFVMEACKGRLLKQGLLSCKHDGMTSPMNPPPPPKEVPFYMYYKCPHLPQFH
jgi:hypothetical protein